MTPLFVDLCKLADGRWVVRRYHPVASIADVQIESVVLPVEICADGWAVSGWPASRFTCVFGFPPSDSPPSQFERIAEYLRFLRINGCLPAISHDGPDCVRVSEQHARWFDYLIDLKAASITDSDEYLRRQIGSAPKSSLAGILRQHGEVDMAFRFLRHCPQEAYLGDALPLAFVPLYVDIGISPDGESSFQFLSRMGTADGHARSWPFVCTHRRVYISANGVVRTCDVAVSDAIFPMEMAQHLRPVDHSGELQPVETPCTQDMCFDQELKEFRELREFPATLRRVVGFLSGASWEHTPENGMSARRESKEKLRGPVLSILHSHTRHITKRMRATLRLHAGLKISDGDVIRRNQH